MAQLRSLIIAILGAWAGLNSAETAPASFETDLRPLIADQCVSCHGEAKHKAGLNLERFRSSADLATEPEVWEHVLGMVRDGGMPPKDKSTLDPVKRMEFSTRLDRVLDDLSRAGQQDPGHVAFHRLSRTEFDNTIRDLLGVDQHVAEDFPIDGGGLSGFDNDAEMLTTSSLLVEKLLAGAGAVLASAPAERILTAKPAADTPPMRHEAARAILADFTRRAFRRPVPPSEIEPYLRLFDKQDKRGISFDNSIRQTLRAVLVSPKFLFRIEPAHPGRQIYAIGPYELASRLSYFVWSSMPDDELFAAAAAGSLGEASALERQVHRMLADPKAAALARGFAPSWLQITELSAGKGPDPSAFPRYAALRDAIAAEPVAMVDAILRRDRPLTDLIDCRYVFVNAGLAALYGIDGVSGDSLREMEIGDRRRGGVLGMAAILAATSRPRRTSPVLRGRWILEVLLDEPPPPPPPKVPPLPEAAAGGVAMSLRKRLEAHRADPACASCHSRIDPLGFGLEQFDPMGQWRTAGENGESLDAVGDLPNGEHFSGPAELKQVVMARKDRFIRAIAGKLLAYGLGRGLEFGDRATLSEILKEIAPSGNRGSDLVLAIVRSFPFCNARDLPPRLTADGKAMGKAADARQP